MTDNNLYANYVAYAYTSRKASGRELKSPLSKQEFLRVWKLASNTERLRWANRFELGYQAIMKEESARYTTALDLAEDLSSKAA